MTPSLLRAAALVPTFVLALSACSADAPGDPPLGERAEPIIGGVDDTGSAANPAVVMIFNGNGACTGSLIAPKLVLTARHCVSQNLQEGIGCDIYGNSTNGNHVGADYPASSFDIYTGVNPNWGSPVASGAQLFHTGGQVVCNNDIALIVLNKSVTGVTPLKVRLDWPPTIGELTTAVGYGSVNNAQQGSGKRRRRPNVPVLTVGQDWNHLTGAGELAVGQAACAGDSGGPVISQGGGVIGIASRVANCNDPNTSAKYVRLDHHKALILQAFAAAGASPSLESGSAPPIQKKGVGEGPCQTGAECISALCQTNGGYCTDFCDANCSSSTTYCAESSISVSGQTIQEKLCVPLPSGTACEQCQATDCPNAVATCLNNAACQALLDCAEGCSDAACLDGCVAQNPAGADDYEVVRYCSCESSCGSACSNLCVGSPGTGGGSGAGGAAGTGAVGGSGASGGAAGTGAAGAAGATAGSGGQQQQLGRSGATGGCAIGPVPARAPHGWWLLGVLGFARWLARSGSRRSSRSRSLR